uniref:hypothetical protein n=1 Tax=Paenibacillus amylolyticus TaxID=1451 RepID=UPI00117CD071|nr:hypothetical protein [Paenibacillus amylolyticus]
MSEQSEAPKPETKRPYANQQAIIYVKKIKKRQPGTSSARLALLLRSTGLATIRRVERSVQDYWTAAAFSSA